MTLHSAPAVAVPLGGHRSRTPARRYQAYILLVFALGLVAVASSIVTLLNGDRGHSWLILAALTVLAGWMSLKVPRVPATVSLSEVFVFTTIMLFGFAPATLAVAADGLITSIRRGRSRPYRLLFNVAEPAISVWVASAVFVFLTGNVPVVELRLNQLLLPALAMSVVYFLLNSWMTAVAVASDTGSSAYVVWRTHFAWLSLNYFGGASIALFLTLNSQQITMGSLAAALPLLVLLYFTFKSGMGSIESGHAHVAEVARMHVATVKSLAMAVDARDQVTHAHLRRVQIHALALAQRMQVTDAAQLKAIEVAALLHDTGKIAVPDYILNKPGRLSPEEYDRIKQHAAVGAEILSAVGFPYPVVPIVRHHHENWDGSGYPDGLRATEIPMGARILSVTDCYDALTSDRPYRRAFTQTAALAVIQERRGSMYDPDVVDAFLEIAPHLSPTGAGELAAAGSPADRHVPALNADTELDASLAPHDSVSSCDDLLALAELSDVLAGRVSFDDAAEMMARHLRRLTPASLVIFYLLDSSSNTLTVSYASGPGEDDVRDVRICLGHGLSGWVATTRATVRNVDPGLDFGDRTDRMSPKLASALATPLMSSGTLIGVMGLYAVAADAFTARDVGAIELVRRPIATLLTLARQFDAGRIVSSLEPVTGLPTLRRLESLIRTDGWLERSWTGSRVVIAVRVPANVARFDGDVLQQVVAAVRRAIPGAELMFWRSSVELVVLLPDAPADSAGQIRERVRTELAAGGLMAAGRPALGLASAAPNATRWKELVARACDDCERHEHDDLLARAGAAFV